MFDLSPKQTLYHLTEPYSVSDTGYQCALFFTVETNHTLVFTLRYNMSILTATETPIHFSSAHITLVSRFPTLKENHTNRSISPTSPLSMNNSLFTLTSWGITRFTTILRVLTPLLTNNLVMRIIIFLINPAAINQISKDTDFLVSNWQMCLS